MCRFFARHPGAPPKGARAGSAFQQRSWSSSFVGLWLLRYRDLARLRRASVLLPKAGLLSLACPRESNHRDGGNAKEKGTPDDAPSVRWTEGTRAGCGVFRQDVLVLSKNWPASMRPPCGLSSTSPPLSYGDPEEPRAKARLRDASASTGPSPRPSPAGGEGEVRCIAYDLEERSQSNGRCEARLRFKSSTIRARCATLRSTRCVASHGCPATTILNRSGLSQHDAASPSL